MLREHERLRFGEEVLFAHRRAARGRDVGPAATATAQCLAELLRELAGVHAFLNKVARQHDDDVQLLVRR